MTQGSRGPAALAENLSSGAMIHTQWLRNTWLNSRISTILFAVSAALELMHIPTQRHKHMSKLK